MTDKRPTNILTVVLATTIPIIAIGIFALALCCSAKKRKTSFLRRGVTPIGDDEIATWKMNRAGEKDAMIEFNKSRHTGNNSVSSIQKPPSVIVYQHQYQPWNRLSEDQSPLSPKSVYQPRSSIEAPPAAVLARAPNSRPGLTDETVQGDDAFIPPLKRQSSRLAKMVPESPRHTRAPSTWSKKSNSREPYWHSRNSDQIIPPRRSADTFTRNKYISLSQPGLVNHKRAHSTSSPPTPRLSSDGDVLFNGLSPRPAVQRSEIGRALG
jgi:hypothetical protein